MKKDKTATTFDFKFPRTPTKTMMTEFAILQSQVLVVVRNANAAIRFEFHSTRKPTGHYIIGEF